MAENEEFDVETDALAAAHGVNQLLPSLYVVEDCDCRWALNMDTGEYLVSMWLLLGDVPVQFTLGLAHAGKLIDSLMDALAEVEKKRSK